MLWSQGVRAMGERLGNYEMIREIAKGGFGRTYEARHIYLDEKACLKQNLNVSKEDALLMIREAKLMWGINHYSLPAMRDFFPAGDGSYIIAMSFVEGKNLEQIVSKHKGIVPEDVSWIAQRSLNALHYLHFHGIIHGDVKPQNIIVQPAVHNAYLVDYGLSSIRPSSGTRALGWTPVFVPPEIEAGKPPIPESDIYGLGLTLIYALGGNPVTKVLPKGVPDAFANFILDMVKFDPTERPNWEKVDLIQKLSDIRQSAFGRRHMM